MKILQLITMISKIRWMFSPDSQSNTPEKMAGKPPKRSMFRLLRHGLATDHIWWERLNLQTKENNELKIFGVLTRYLDLLPCRRQVVLRSLRRWLSISWPLTTQIKSICLSKTLDLFFINYLKYFWIYLSHFSLVKRLWVLFCNHFFLTVPVNQNWQVALG